MADPRTMGVILGIDYGTRRLGLALSDEKGVTSRPFATWTRINRRRDLARLRDLARQRGVRRIVVGLPVHLNGAPSEMSEEASRFAARIEAALGIPVVMMDERLSSWEARQAEAATPHRSRRGKARGSVRKRGRTFDDVAAAVILRDYLNRTRAPAGTQL